MEARLVSVRRRAVADTAYDGDGGTEEGGDRQ